MFVKGFDFHFSRLSVYNFKLSSFLNWENNEGQKKLFIQGTLVQSDENAWLCKTEMGFIYTMFDENSWLCKTEMEFIYTRFDENSWLCKT